MDSKIFLLIQGYVISFYSATIYLVAKQLKIWRHIKKKYLAFKNIKKTWEREREEEGERKYIHMIHSLELRKFNL